METTLDRVEFVQRRIAERLEIAKTLRERAAGLNETDPESAEDYRRRADDAESVALGQRSVLLTLFPHLDL